MLPHILIALIWTILTILVCKLEDNKKAIIDLWKVFMVIGTIVICILLVFRLLGVIK